MINKLAKALFGVGFLLLAACSSAPEKVYDVTTYQSLSYALLDMADRKRQLEHYDEAIKYYLQGESYALKRNDKITVGLSRLKRAAIHLIRQQHPQAWVLISDVEQMNQYESLDLDNALLFLKARFAHANGDTPSALSQLKQLEQAYAASGDIEKQIYYRLVGWQYQPASIAAVSLSAIEQDIAVLDIRVETHQQNNIEIYSYALYHYAKRLVELADPKAVQAIDKAIKHFSRLELTSKIRDCYQLAADYYAGVGDVDKAAYFNQQISVQSL
ncbi:MAG: hypothetical protein ACI8WB_001934 [Phenylobacterium sp.]|jgi:hypothetical protein